VRPSLANVGLCRGDDSPEPVWGPISRCICSALAGRTLPKDRLQSMTQLLDRLRIAVQPAVQIPRPQSAPYTVLGWRQSRGEDAVAYEIPKRANTRSNSTKRITCSALEASFSELQSSGSFTRSWFDQNLPDLARDGACNFTAIGGIFVVLGEAVYGSRGHYVRTAVGHDEAPCERK